MARLARARVILIAMAAVGTPAAASAQASLAQPAIQRGWIDVNFGVAEATQRQFDVTKTITVSREPADFSVKYGLPTGASFDFGGGVLFTRAIGIGVSFSGTAHEDDAELHIRIPHPLFFNAYAADTAPTEAKLMRVESGTHVQLMAVPYDRGGVRVRVFIGPSFFRARQQSVSDIRYSQVFGVFTTSNTVDITRYESREVEGTGWGFHAGADVSWFFNRVVGLGGLLRVSHGTVDIPDALEDSGTVTIKTGGLQAGGGLRLRF